VPRAAAGPVGGFAKRLGLADFSPDQLDLLAFGRGLDTTAMRQVFGFEPEFTTREAFADFARSLPALLPGTEALDAAVSGAAESVGAAVGGLIDVTTRQVDQVSAWTRRDH
jgi:UDP-glucose 4-epimerase